MKPLSIEEIKELRVSDWIYIIDLTDLNITDYYKISQFFESEIKTLFNYKAERMTYRTFNYEDYGTKWLAYKNKEQADCESELIDKNKVIKFIEELAWKDVQYDAFQSVMDTSKASLTAIPKYAKKYFDLWKEMFDEKLKELRGKV